MVAMVLLGIGVLVLACGGGRREGPTEHPPAVRARLAPVVRVTQAPRLEIVGTVVAERNVAVSSRVMAMVTAVHVQTGATVRAGESLIEIDPQTARGQESQARGALAAAEAGLVLAERNFERFKALATRQAAADLEVDMARMQYEQATGAVEQAKGAVEAASSVARESSVVAPFAGRIAARLVEVGDLAAPGRPLVMIESSRGRRLLINVPESSAATAVLAIGLAVPVRIDSLPSLGELAGRVVEVTPGADPVTHAFAVKIELPGDGLATGLAGRALMPGAPRPMLVAPAGACHSQGGMTFVAIRDAAGLARRRIVTTGVTLPGGLEILSGLTGAETLLVDLPTLPADGAPVEEVR